jgi:adenosylcobyric acid synthase
VKLESGDDGAISADGQILGTYVHGLFDRQEACAALLRWAGLAAPAMVDYEALREAGIERMADAVEAHLDWHLLEQFFS